MLVTASKRKTIPSAERKQEQVSRTTKTFACSH